jgi:hypothetical protein
VSEAPESSFVDQVVGFDGAMAMARGVENAGDLTGGCGAIVDAIEVAR